MKVYRRNYDKYHRCPSWSGPAFKGGNPDSDCPGGSRVPYEGVARCPDCGAVVLPIWARWLDPTYLWWRIQRLVLRRY